MFRVILVMLLVLITGCSGVAVVKSSSSPSAKTVKAEKWMPIMQGSRINVDVYYEYEMKLNNGRLLSQNDWNNYLKPFIEDYSQDQADIIINGITRYFWEYDKVDKKIKFEPLRYISGPYSNSKYVSMQGAIEKDKFTGLIKFKYYGPSWIFAKSIKVVADDFTWQSPNLEFYRDNYRGNVWEYAYLNISNPEHRSLAENIASSKEVIIRFQGRQYYSDLSLSSRMKEDLLAMIKVIDVVSGN
jgi:hypothetical protein